MIIKKKNNKFWLLMHYYYLFPIKIPFVKDHCVFKKIRLSRLVWVTDHFTRIFLKIVKYCILPAANFAKTTVSDFGLECVWERSKTNWSQVSKICAQGRSTDLLLLLFQKTTTKTKPKRQQKQLQLKKKQCEKDTRSLKQKCNKRRREKERVRLN